MDAAINILNLFADELVRNAAAQKMANPSHTVLEIFFAGISSKAKYVIIVYRIQTTVHKSLTGNLGLQVPIC